MRKKNGFTLIEIIVIILLIALISTITIITVQDKINTSKDTAQILTNDALFQAANGYVTEFKNNSNSWYKEYTGSVGNYQETGNEYACTTIQMLIDKGFLKNNLKNPSTKEDINHDIFIKVVRDSQTKVIQKQVILDSEDCSSLDDELPSVTFTPNGLDTPQKPLTVTITPKVGPSGINKMTYYLKQEGKIKTTEYTSTSEENIELNIEGTDIHVCANVINGIDKTSGEICSNSFIIDNTSPIVEKLDYTLGSNTIKAHIIEKNIDSYCITKENNSTSCTWHNINVNDFDITVSESATYYVYVKDKVDLINDNSTSNVVTVNIDSTIPSVSFNPNGNTNYTNSKEVTITPEVGISSVKSMNYYIKVNNTKYKENTSNTKDAKILLVDIEGSDIYVCANITNGINIPSGEICSNPFMIDNTSPIVTATSTVGSLNINISVIEKNIDSYCVTQENSSTNCTWTKIAVNTFTKEADASGTYNIYVKDKADNIGKDQVTIILEKTAQITCTVSSTSSSCTKTDTISDLNKIVSITSDTGSVNYTQNGTSLTLNFTGGTYQAGTATSCNCTTTSTKVCTCGEECCTPPGGGASGTSRCVMGPPGGCLNCTDISCVAGMCPFNDCDTIETTSCDTCYTYKYTATIKYIPK